jgi:hypothetical protein
VKRAGDYTGGINWVLMVGHSGLHLMKRGRALLMALFLAHPGIHQPRLNEYTGQHFFVGAKDNRRPR